MSADHDHEHHDEYRPSEISLRVKAIELLLLVEKKLLDPVAVDKLVDAYENKIGPHNGARVVAKAWADPEFNKWLLGDGTKAIQELGIRAYRAKTWWSWRTLTKSTTWSFARWAPAILGRRLHCPRTGTGRLHRSRAVIDPRGGLEGVWRRASEGR